MSSKHPLSVTNKEKQVGVTQNLREHSDQLWAVRMYKRRHTHTDEEYGTSCEKQHTR